MSDCSDVENALVAVIAQAVYPDGTGHPSVIGVPCRITRGWPIPQSLDKALAAGKIKITVFPMDNEQKTTRYPGEWQTLSMPEPTLTLTPSGSTITVSGTPSSPLNAAAIVDGISYLYPVQPSDTLTSIATGLAALIDADTATTSDGPVVTLAGTHRITTRVGVVGTIIRETRRQKRGFQIIFWCPDPQTRDAIVPPVDSALADLDYLSLPDGSSGRLLYERTRVSDRQEREGLYRRDLFYSVEYPTTDVGTAAEIVLTTLYLTDPSGLPIASPGDLILAEDGQAILDGTGQRVREEEDVIATEGGTTILAEDGERIIID